jgi:dynein heavy chain
MTVFLGVANAPQFAPTAKKFHYQFNLRDFSKIIENMMLTQPAQYKGRPLDIVRLWAHECHRTWRDRLITEDDIKLYNTYMNNAIKDFGDMKADDIFEEPIIYTSFVATCEGHEASHLPIKSVEHLRGVLESKLEEYNENIASMNLVLFDQAMEHITRIARIIDLDAGNALLVGVGGSGK